MKKFSEFLEGDLFSINSERTKKIVKLHKTDKKDYPVKGDGDAPFKSDLKTDKKNSPEKDGVDPAKLKESEEQLDELSKKTLGSYINKAAESKKVSAVSKLHFDDAAYKAKKSGHKGDEEFYSSEKNKANSKVNNRTKGISRAVSRLTKESEDLEEEKLSPADKMQRDIKFNAWKYKLPMYILKYGKDKARQKLYNDVTKSVVDHYDPEGDDIQEDWTKGHVATADYADYGGNTKAYLVPRKKAGGKVSHRWLDDKGSAVDGLRPGNYSKEKQIAHASRHARFSNVKVHESEQKDKARQKLYNDATKAVVDNYTPEGDDIQEDWTKGHVATADYADYGGNTKAYLVPKKKAKGVVTHRWVDDKGSAVDGLRPGNYSKEKQIAHASRHARFSNVKVHESNVLIHADDVIAEAYGHYDYNLKPRKGDPHEYHIFNDNGHVVGKDKDLSSAHKMADKLNMQYGHRSHTVKAFFKDALRLKEHEQLDELSRKTLANYVKHATDDAISHKERAGQQLQYARQRSERGDNQKAIDAHMKASEDHDKKSMKRKLGVVRAAEKLAKD